MNIESIKEIYEHLSDVESRRIFEKRLMNMLTGDEEYLMDMITGLPQLKIWDEYVERTKNITSDLIVYGACVDFGIFHRIYPDINFKFFCDRDKNKQKNGWFGKTVISPETLLKEYRDNPILINAQDYNEEIEKFLLDNGIPQGNILNMGRDLSKEFGSQYFDDEVMPKVSDEIFVDGGAYDLETAKKFCDWCGGNYKKIYSFEPNEDSYEMCINRLDLDPVENLVLLNRGLWDEETELCFSMQGEGSSIDDASTDGEIKIKTASVDDVVGDDKVTLIKFDIEGAELKGLKGAKNTIIKNKPRLAICIYHKPEDIVELPAYILSLVPEYKLYIRHYKISFYETVLYAIP